MKRPWRAIASSAGLAGILLAACGGSGSASERSAVPAASPTEAPAAEAAPAAPVPAATATAPALDDEPLEPPTTSAACGSARQCYDQARRALRGHPDQAAALFEEACEQDLAQGCSELANLYEDGRGVAADDRRARQLRERACELGSTAACDDLGH